MEGYETLDPSKIGLLGALTIASTRHRSLDALGYEGALRLLLSRASWR